MAPKAVRLMVAQGRGRPWVRRRPAARGCGPRGGRGASRPLQESGPQPGRAQDPLGLLKAGRRSVRRVRVSPVHRGQHAREEGRQGARRQAPRAPRAAAKAQPPAAGSSPGREGARNPAGCPDWDGRCPPGTPTLSRVGATGGRALPLRRWCPPGVASERGSPELGGRSDRPTLRWWREVGGRAPRRPTTLTEAGSRVGSEGERSPPLRWCGPPAMPRRQGPPGVMGEPEGPLPRRRRRATPLVRCPCPRRMVTADPQPHRSQRAAASGTARW